MAKSRFKRRLKWSPGDLFAVPLCDGTFGFAQAVAPVDTWAVDFALLAIRSSKPELPPERLQRNDAVAVHATWRTVITGGHWCFTATNEILISPELCPNQRLIAAGQIGVSHSSWGLLEDFLSAYHGAFPWNLYPAFDFDSFLLPGVTRPSLAMVLNPAQLAIARANEKERVHAA
jgi:hypothetical protein